MSRLNELLGLSHGDIPVLLAPMAGITDKPFRALCRQFGADFAYTEMVSAKGFHYGSAATKRLAEFSESDFPCGIQLFGSSPEILAETAAMLEDEMQGRLSLIDINMGCPARKITSNCEGSSLMLNIPLASRIIRAVSDAVKLPVTVKFRKGWDDEHINAVEFAMAAEDSGASAVTVHGRTRQQMYRGQADWDIIAKVRAAVSIPVIGNGDVFSGEAAKKLLDRTGCDGIMIARGAEGYPFIFNEVKAALKGENYTPPTEKERMETALLHLKMHREQKGDAHRFEVRKHIAWYASGIRGASDLRQRANLCGSYEELEELLNDFIAKTDG